MTQKKLHPSVQKFKEFVRDNPKIIQEVRKGKSTWQELYEDWYLLGEEDKRWETIGSEPDSESGSESDSEPEKNKESQGDWMSNIMGMVKKMDPNQMQNHINNLSQALGAIQGVIAQFQGSNPTAGPVKPIEGPKNPFLFRKD
ncbi:hypothetical protein BACCIP111895_00521 [Neobacillus rhizosphaerae]|uniref:Cytosolic protein n=1 Tax=Neobacillus rhizosphaerae TaxID=2880965 RepID=A0ABM9ELE4_9BACI|nr:YlbD family protein [Neobacillus rhizosphaerae]CAH2713386.1 hypothetical protein BACCIP111895_00521 [Neobacillus rhizosphaerae]